MRLLFLPTVTAIVLLADQTAWAQSTRVGCLVNPGRIQTDGITNREMRTRAGHPCRINLSSRSGWRVSVHAVQVSVPPAYGNLRTSERTGGSGIITYVPQPGFIGHDRFEAYWRYTDFALPHYTLYKVEVTVTP